MSRLSAMTQKWEIKKPLTIKELEAVVEDIQNGDDVDAVYILPDMSYEAEQDYLLRLFREVEEGKDPIDEESGPEKSNVGKRTENGYQARRRLQSEMC
ncbi:hypothetical protein ILUMI_16955 [Ignelater luminosus]|uniref:Uncharacterized protein n=1 Tax=Ignelater luminosus TaxID=2038154 RepID=A0A8K0CRC3_IGNLU|nr:hypothetical protein ILUMI_16955 [Ignelater luminosus]